MLKIAGGILIAVAVVVVAHESWAYVVFRNECIQAGTDEYNTYPQQPPPSDLETFIWIKTTEPNPHSWFQ